jgi:hypothetical protein
VRPTIDVGGGRSLAIGFAATTRSGEPIQIALGERDGIRSLSGRSLVQAFTTEIQRQTER